MVKRKLETAVPAVILDEFPAERQRVCNCKKSHCLKLYCDCFSGGVHCGWGCNCANCQNTANPEHAQLSMQRGAVYVLQQTHTIPAITILGASLFQQSQGCGGSTGEERSSIQ
eukprot:19221-Heterococcus_DN1.PRE.5